jgi:glucose/arabinose dehydrogenase
MVALTSVITGLSSPMQVTHAGDNSHRLFVVEKGGVIKGYDSTFVFIDTLLRITGLNTSGEQGLLSLAFHPQFRDSGYFYIYYTAPGSSSSVNVLTLDRYKISSANPNRALVSSRLNILSISHPATNHNGGKINFGKDGYLYLSTGDSGGSGDPQNFAQNTGSLLGKLLRIDINSTSGTNNYLIPPNNPFGNQIYALGLRNPFRWTFDRYNGDLYLGDVGQGAQEEINYTPRDSIAGVNFGWRCYEGQAGYNTSGCAGQASYKSPKHSYIINSANGRSIIGGIRYRGYQYPELKDWYFAIDYFTSNLLIFDRSSNNWTPTLQNVGQSNLCDFSEGEDGEVYICKNSNTVYQLTHANARPVYVFSGSGSWSNTSNWKRYSKPPDTLNSGFDIVIKPYNGGVCTLNAPQVIKSGSKLLIEPGSKLVLNASLKTNQ